MSLVVYWRLITDALLFAIDMFHHSGQTNPRCHIVCQISISGGRDFCSAQPKISNLPGDERAHRVMYVIAISRLMMCDLLYLIMTSVDRIMFREDASCGAVRSADLELLFIVTSSVSRCQRLKIFCTDLAFSTHVNRVSPGRYSTPAGAYALPIFCGTINQDESANQDGIPPNVVVLRAPYAEWATMAKHFDGNEVMSNTRRSCVNHIRR
jgi:hypothetical protein